MKRSRANVPEKSPVNVASVILNLLFSFSLLFSAIDNVFYYLIKFVSLNIALLFIYFITSLYTIFIPRGVYFFFFWGSCLFFCSVFYLLHVMYRDTHSLKYSSEENIFNRFVTPDNFGTYV